MDYRQGNGYPGKSDDLTQTCDSLITNMVPILQLRVSGFSVTGLGSFSIVRWGLLPYPWAGLLTCVGQQNAEEVAWFQFQVSPSGNPATAFRTSPG